MGVQTVYQSWQIRLKQLNAATYDAESRAEQRQILETLLAKYADDAAARQAARFPIDAAPPAHNPKKIKFNIRRAFSLVRDRMETRATQRIEPVVHEIARLDPQRDAAQFVRERRDGRLGPGRTVRAKPRDTAGQNGGLVVALMTKDIIDVVREASAQFAQRVPELLFTDIKCVPGEFTRLVASYARSMWGVLSHSDARDPVGYMVEELEQHDAENDDRATKRRRRTAIPGDAQLFMNRRAILIHAYAREKERNVELAVHRVLHPVADNQRSGAKSCDKPLLETLSEDLHACNAAALTAYGEKLIEENGRALDAFAERLDHRLFLTDDVLKAFYVNLVYVSKAIRLLNRHGVVANHAPNGPATDVDAENREQLHDQIAELLRDPVLRARALQRFRMELADGTSSVRLTAIGMLGRLGTLDDIGLLLELESLLPPGPASRTERRALLEAARRISGNVECRMPNVE